MSSKKKKKGKQAVAPDDMIATPRSLISAHNESLALHIEEMMLVGDIDIVDAITMLLQITIPAGKEYTYGLSQFRSRIGRLLKIADDLNWALRGDRQLT